MAQPVVRPLDAHRSLHVLLRVMVFAVGLGKIGVAHAGAIVPDPGCAASTLPANDDAISGPVDLGFTVGFGGSSYSQVYVDNNGFVRFRPDDILWWRLKSWENTTIPVIAPFLADVDTRPEGTQVSYGQITFAGRSALCINWVQVGYFDQHADKLNSFQLILVDRSDAGPGAFDIVMNYDSITWEAGDGAGAVGGIGGSFRPRAGFYDGTHSTELPGSLGTLVLLDGGPDSLSGNSTNDITPGRHVFPIRTGVDQWTVSGTVSDPQGNPLSGALLQVCLNGSVGPACVGARTDGQGHYTFTVTDPAPLASQWSFQVSPPQGTTFLPYSTTLNLTGDTQFNVTLNAAFGTPLGTALQPGTVDSSGVVRVYWQAPLVLTTRGCLAGVATYTISSGTNLLQTGVMTESPPLSGRYQANVPALSPAHGYAVVDIEITCPGGAVGTFAFDLYIDPSGTVRTTRGVPVPGALVTLYRAASPLGPFEVVPDGSAFMAPTNRTNPDHTDQVGHFGWDVMMGFYVVRAEKAGCVAPNDPSRPYVETPVLPVPPEWTDLELVLDCPDLTPPELTVPSNITVDATSASGAVVAYTASAVDAEDGPVPVSCTWASGAVFPLGTTTVTCSTADSSGNSAQASFAVKVTFAWTGVLPPLDAGRRTGFKHGATVPVKFALAGGSRDVHEAEARLFIANLQTPEQELPAESTGHSNIGNLFRFAPDEGVYIFNLSTRPHAPGSYRLRIDLGDGVLRTALLDLTD